MDDIDLVVQSTESIKLYTDDDYKFIGEVVTLCGKEKTFRGYETVETLVWSIRAWLFKSNF